MCELIRVHGPIIAPKERLEQVLVVEWILRIISQSQRTQGTCHEMLADYIEHANLLAVLEWCLKNQINNS